MAYDYHEAGAEVYGGPYDGVINYTLAKLLLSADAPSSPEAYARIQAVQREGHELVSSDNQETVLRRGDERLEQTKEAVRAALAGTFVPNEQFQPGFDTVAKCLVGLFEREGMPAVTLTASRILEATEPEFVAYHTLDIGRRIREDFDNAIMNAQNLPFGDL
jgi:hypothetical protein